MRPLIVAILMFLGSQAVSAEFFVLPGTKTLLVMGETKSADALTLEKYIAEKEIGSLILKGPGGDLYAGYQMADVVLEHDLSITIPADTDCASACSLIFAAGKVRIMEAGSRLGFHLPFLKLKDKDDLDRYCEQVASDRNTNNKSFKRKVLGPSGASEECVTLTFQSGLRAMRNLSRIFDRDGISAEVINIIIETPSFGMTWVSVNQAKTFGLVNVD
jgi:hypothetical protein